ncbi:MAG: outer membrane protein assembly factor BamD [Thiohalophilus sp.]
MIKIAYQRIACKLIAVIALAALSSSCAMLGGEQRQNDEAAALYQQAMTAREDGQLEASLEHLDTLLSDYPNTPQGQRAVLEKAYTHYHLENYHLTIEQTSTWLEQGDEADTRERAYARFLRAEAARALWDADTSSPPKTSLARQAFAYYRKVVEYHPESKEIKTTFQRMQQLRRDLAAEELRRAREDMNSGDFATAAERAAWVAEQYRGVRHAADALALQAEALENLNRDREAEATLRMLQILYPDHPAVE